jgi:hypothetical protein
MPTITYTVRQVSRGFWTYDLCFHDEGSRFEYSVGEAHSRREAERKAKQAVRLETAEREG